MQLAYQRGVLVLPRDRGSPPSLLPNLAIVPKVDAAYQEQIADAAVRAAFLTNNMSKAYRNFLRDVPYQFFLVNRVREGQQWLQYLREKFPDAVATNLTLADYVVQRASDEVQSGGQVKVIRLVEGFVTQSYYALLDDNADESNTYMARAQEIWEAYDKRTQGSARTALIPLKQMQILVLKGLLGTNSNLTPEDKARLRTLRPEAAEIGSPSPAAQK
jgi:hypothetical protein